MHLGPQTFLGRLLVLGYLPVVSQSSLGSQTSRSSFWMSLNPQTSPGPQTSLGPQTSPGPQTSLGPQASPGPHTSLGPHTYPGPHTSLNFRCLPVLRRRSDLLLYVQDVGLCVVMKKRSLEVFIWRRMNRPEEHESLTGDEGRIHGSFYLKAENSPYPPAWMGVLGEAQAYRLKSSV